MSKPRAIDVCRVTDGSDFSLADHPTDWTGAEDQLPSGLKLHSKHHEVAGSSSTASA